MELIAPAVGGVDDERRRSCPGRPEDRRWPVRALRRRRILLASKDGAPALAAQPGAYGLRDRRLRPLQVHRLHRRRAARCSRRAGLAGNLIDDGFVDLGRISAADFIARCAELRFWPRQASIAQRAGAAKASAGEG